MSNIAHSAKHCQARSIWQVLEALSSDPPLKQSEFILIYQIKTNR